MPAPNANMLSMLAKTTFASNGITLPENWQQPQGDAGKQFAQSFGAAEHSHVPMPSPPALFRAASSLKAHCDIQKGMSDAMSEYIDGVCDAIATAWSTWQSTATMTGVIIAGPVATGGTVIGPPLTPLILAKAPKSSESKMLHSAAIATAVGTAWLQYQSTIIVPGLPWYPAFAMFAGPLAPPMPNIPAPLVALTQVTTSLTRSPLKSSMKSNFAGKGYHTDALFDCIADAIAKSFTIWQASTQVTQVMGMGPIPTFAPPVVPGGPVVGGNGTMTPGGFV